MRKASFEEIQTLWRWLRMEGSLPLRFVLLEDFPLGVISDDPNIDEAAQVKLLCPKLCHESGCWMKCHDFECDN